MQSRRNFHVPSVDGTKIRTKFELKFISNHFVLMLQTNAYFNANTRGIAGYYRLETFSLPEKDVSKKGRTNFDVIRISLPVKCDIQYKL